MNRILDNHTATLIAAWVVGSLVAWLFMWAALNAPPFYAMVNGSPRPTDRLEVFAGIVVAGWILHGGVFFMLLNLKGMTDAYNNLKGYL